MIAVDFIAQELARRGMRLFAFGGGTVCPLFDACHRYGVEIVIARSEQGAGYMAVGAAKATGQVQCVAVTSGPGSTNLVTPIADAFYDSVPIIAFTGQVNLSYHGFKVRQRGFQQTPVVSIFSPIAKYANLALSPNDLVTLFELAFTRVNMGRRGPVVLDIPMDCQKGDVDWTPIRTAIEAYNEFYVPDNMVRPLPQSLSLLPAFFNASSQPVILAGAGCLASANQLRALVGKLGIPVVTSLPAAGILPSDDAHAFGFIGHTGLPWANWIVHNSDLVLALGSRLDVRQTGTEVDKFAPNAKVIMVNNDQAELDNARVRVDLKLNADCGQVLEWMLENVSVSDEWIYRTEEWWIDCNVHCVRLDHNERIANGETAKVIQEISNASPDDCIFVTGVGSHQQHSARHLHLDYPKRQFVTSSGHGCMGAGLPMAVGAAISTGRHIVLIDGDGSFQMSMNELGTVAAHDLDIDIHIINNRSGGIVSQFARLNNYSPDETTWRNPDFTAIAEAYGLSVMVHETSEEAVFPILEGGHDMSDMTWEYPK